MKLLLGALIICLFGDTQSQNILSSSKNTLVLSNFVNTSFKQVTFNLTIVSLEIVSSNFCATGHIDGTISLWNLLSLDIVLSSRNHFDQVSSIIKINDSVFVSASLDRTILFWNTTNLKVIKKWEDSDPIEILVYYNNRSLIMSTSFNGSGLLKARDISTGSIKFQKKFDSKITAFEKIPNGEYIIAYQNILEADSFFDRNQTAKTIKLESNIQSLKYVSYQQVACGFSTGQISIINSTSLSILENISAHSMNVTCFDILDNCLYSGSLDKSIMVWEMSIYPSSILTLNYHSDGLINIKVFEEVYETMDSNSSNATTGSSQYSQTTTSQTLYNNSSKIDDFIGEKELMEMSFFNSTTSTQITPNSNSSNATTGSSQYSQTIHQILYSSVGLVDIGYLTNIHQITYNINTLPISHVIDLLKQNIDSTFCLTNCSNRGSCILDANKYRCLCNQNFTGSFCQFDLRPCSSNPCLNKGNCSQNELSFSCTCSENFHGNFCEKERDLCQNETCSGNGICNYVNFEPKCKCFPMYEGLNCQIETNSRKLTQATIRTSSIIAILILAFLTLMLLISDFKTFFNKSIELNKKKKKSNDSKKIGPKYKN
ncbi:unnamed protein product [Brachionus calyciflorus]|uniref:EGF-like domain-containing protein n=1 Tax=Brachionus calyciflorus TaxID=104777 RepID=A0A813Q783_9BILA|nr:unnamed protein product [Brachionus calyciflorus]